MTAGAERPLGVYLHIPFCAQKCAYCHFAIDPGQPADSRRDRYLAALAREIDASNGGLADTIYFGGGTPSLVPPRHISELIGALRARYDIAAFVRKMERLYELLHESSRRTRRQSALTLDLSFLHEGARP